MVTSSPTPTSQRPVVAAYYFPNYHVDARNAKAHGPGWMEWELVRRAEPRFPGHRQPLVPAWGYEDEADPAVMARKIEAATTHGVNCFLFDWYYYDDGPFLERCLEEGFLKAKNVSDIQFACMWANHDWIHIHPAKRTTVPALLYPGKVTPKTFDYVADLMIDRYFSHPSHLKVNGAPFFSIYDLGPLLATFGDSVLETRKGLDRFRSKAVQAGFPDLHLNAIGRRTSLLAGEAVSTPDFALAQELGFDSIGHYVWAHFTSLSGSVPTVDFSAACRDYFEGFDKEKPLVSLPVYPNVTMGWDSTPRTVQSDVWNPTIGYPFTQIYGKNSPEAFREALIMARERISRMKGFSMVTLNAWNEWTEGSYLEPDTVTGYAYLEAIRDVFPPVKGEPAPAGRPRRAVPA